MVIEIVDLPTNSMVIFHSYVNVYQRVIHVLLVQVAMSYSYRILYRLISACLIFLVTLGMVYSLLA